jgi:hypothetical protein
MQQLVAGGALAQHAQRGGSQLQHAVGALIRMEEWRRKGGYGGKERQWK